MTTYLCIGGAHDGERIEIDRTVHHGLLWEVRPKLEPLDYTKPIEAIPDTFYTVSVYRAVQWTTDDTGKQFVFIPPDQPDDYAVRQMIERYKAPQPPPTNGFARRIYAMVNHMRSKNEPQIADMLEGLFEANSEYHRRINRLEGDLYRQNLENVRLRGDRQTLAAITALVPLVEMTAACQDGQTLVDWFKERLNK